MFYRASFSSLLNLLCHWIYLHETSFNSWLTAKQRAIKVCDSAQNISTLSCLSSFARNKSIEIPPVHDEILQLTLFGPPVPEYRPPDYALIFFFRFEAMLSQSIYLQSFPIVTSRLSNGRQIKFRTNYRTFKPYHGQSKANQCNPHSKMHS